MKNIGFSEELQREVVARQKTETRRLTNPQPDDYLKNAYGDFFLPDGRRVSLLANRRVIRPRYEFGEIIYIKEPYTPHPLGLDRVFYKYDQKDIKDLQELGYGDYLDNPGFWWSKEHMPARMARYFLRITDRYGERLQDISEESCKKEGIFSDALECNFGLPNIQRTALETVLGKSWREAYARLIDSTYGAGTWKNNPFVWVYCFEFLPELTTSERRLYKLTKR
jgi:hypothetical protein